MVKGGPRTQRVRAARGYRWWAIGPVYVPTVRVSDALEGKETVDAGCQLCGYCDSFTVIGPGGACVCTEGATGGDWAIHTRQSDFGECIKSSNRGNGSLFETGAPGLLGAALHDKLCR